MFDAPTDAQQAAAQAEEDLGLVEERLAMLRELAQIGMEIARARGREALSVDPDDQGWGQPSLGDSDAAFDRAARTVRLTLILQARTQAERAAAREGRLAALAADRAAQAAARTAAAQARRRRLEEAVGEAIAAELPGRKARQECHEALEERLDQDEAYADVLRLPFGETVARLCADLQLAPDWSRWDAAREGWGGGEGDPRPPWSVFRTPSRRPLVPPPFRARPPSSPGAEVAAARIPPWTSS